MKKYQYNYSYLGRWMDANPQITNREIMQSFGSVNNNNSLALYEQRKTPMPIINLLRFCNTFNVPISAFIVGIDADDEGSIDKTNDCTYTVNPSIDDQLEPDGGYIAVGERRPHGSRALRDPLEVEHIKSVVPGLTAVKTTKQEIQTEHEVQTGGIHQSATANDQASIHQTATTAPAEPQDGISLATLNKMLDIIAEQQKQIAGQQQLISEQQKEIIRLTHYSPISSIGMAAEERHRSVE